MGEHHPLEQVGVAILALTALVALPSSPFAIWWLVADVAYPALRAMGLSEQQTVLVLALGAPVLVGAVFIAVGRTLRMWGNRRQSQRKAKP